MLKADPLDVTVIVEKLGLSKKQKYPKSHECDFSGNGVMLPINRQQVDHVLSRTAMPTHRQRETGIL